jgi:hypothetical protein
MATYDMEQISENLQGYKNLPSLESVQFSKDNDGTLYIHMHLRALEASRFLNININEVLYLLEMLKNENIEFEKVNITISAFRVQIKDNFACFLKAGIDSIPAPKLGIIVQAEEWMKICGLLEEKRDASETITHSGGIEVLRDTINYFIELRQENGLPPLLDEGLPKLLNEILENYNKLDNIQQTKSIQGEEERMIEEKIKNELNEVIEKFRYLSNQKERKIE